MTETYRGDGPTAGALTRRHLVLVPESQKTTTPVGPKALPLRLLGDAITTLRLLGQSRCSRPGRAATIMARGDRLHGMNGPAQQLVQTNTSYPLTRSSRLRCGRVDAHAVSRKINGAGNLPGRCAAQGGGLTTSPSRSVARPAATGYSRILLTAPKLP